MQAQARIENEHALKDWIVSQRMHMALGIEADLPAWPEWPGGCHDLSAYFTNVGSEFARRCGPVIKSKVETVAGACLEGIDSPSDLISQVTSCTGNATTVPFWVTELTRCTLTSYLTAMEMSEHDR